ncbi:hypothetical protein GTQ40_07610 [Flavobacteriaceae bacterium R38]|nr:hypothetical protein [Flavobacteriaceae bacterium R38]
MIPLFSIGQEKQFHGYRIDGDEVVFVFDKRDYNRFSLDGSWKKQTIDDLKIKNVGVSGEFNDWSRNHWKMAQIDENRYELRKKISDFDDEFSWEFKFIINDQYWAEPSEHIQNITPAHSENGHPLHVYNLKMFAAYPKENGNAVFKLKGYEDADRVILSGSFNKWNESLFVMNKTDEGWQLRLQMKPGRYEYKFIVDGKWLEDKSNPENVRNEFNGFNSVIEIKKEIAFHLKGYSNAKKVILSGSFNDWSEENYKMIKTKDGWVFKTKLSAGKHHYKFIVDGTWITDPSNPVKEYDYEYNINSVCMIR